MFQSKLAIRIHHLYLVQALVQVQRRCNLWYSRMKHKVIVLITKRLQSSRLKVLSKLVKKQSVNHEEKSHHTNSTNRHFDVKGNNIFEDLNQMWTHSCVSNAAISIPMQMLLLPFIMQPYNGRNGAIDKDISADSYRTQYTVGDSIKKQNCQQWHETRHDSQFMTISSGQLIPVSDLHSCANPMNDCSALNRPSQLPVLVDCQQTSWSSPFKTASSQGVKSSSDASLTMRNPLMYYAGGNWLSNLLHAPICCNSAAAIGNVGRQAALNNQITLICERVRACDDYGSQRAVYDIESLRKLFICNKT